MIDKSPRHAILLNIRRIRWRQITFFQGFKVVCNHIATALADDREKWILSFAMFFGLGQAIFLSLHARPFAAYLVAGLIASAFGLWLSRQRIIPFFTVLMLFATFAGASLVQFHLYLVQAPVLKKPVYTASLIGAIVSVEPRDGRTRLVIAPSLIDGIKNADVPAKIRISLQGAIHAVPGDIFSGKAKLFPLGVPETPGDPDFARALYFDGIGGTGFALGRNYQIEPKNRAGTNLLEATGRLRLAIMARINQTLPELQAGLANAILVGERGGVPPELAEDLRKSGLAHLLAISGLHMGLLCGVVFFVARLMLSMIPAIALRYPIKKWSAVAGFMVGALYLLLSGATVPTQRAFVMTAIVLFAVLVDRRAISLRLVAIAALVVMVVRPDAVLGASFQLSFAAVTVLVAFYQGPGAKWMATGRDVAAWERAGRYFGLLLITGVMVTAITAPIIGFHFGRVSLLGVLANLVAIPLMALWIMPCIVATLVFMPFGLEVVPLTILSPALEILIHLARLVAGQDWGLWYVARPSAMVVAPILLALLWGVIWRKWPVRGLAMVPVLGAIGTMFFVYQPDILVGGSQKDWVIRNPVNGTLVFNGKISSFHRSIWMSRFGINPSKAVMQTDRCGESVCWFERNGQRIVIAETIDDPFYICRHADIIVVLKQDFPKGACKTRPLIIDDDVLWWQGGAAAFLPVKGEPATYRTVRDTSGYWPWISIGGR